MKIAITVENFDENKGYLEYYLAKELVKLGNNVLIITFNRGKEVVERTLEGFKVIYLPYILKVGPFHIPTLKALKYLVKVIKQSHLDVIHCQPLLSFLSLFSFLLKNLYSYECVGSLITGYYNIRKPVKKLAFYMYIGFFKLLLRKQVKYIFAINKNVAKLIHQLFNVPYHQIMIIPLGADPDLFKPYLLDGFQRVQIREKLGIGSNDTVICYSGKIIPSKRLHLLLKAVSEIVKEKNYGNNVKILIIGRGDKNYIRYLKRLVSNLNLDGNVIFHPPVHRLKLPLFYNISDIAVWPGAPSISILEAASTGLPVITGSPLFYEEIEKYNMGFTFRDNIDKFKKCLEMLIENKLLREKIGSNARKNIIKRFNWSLIAREYINIYADLK